MSRIVRCVVVFCLMASAIGLSSAHANSKYAAYVVHADSGDVLFDRYSTARRYPASLTKMMTLYLLFDEIEAGRLTLDSKLSVSSRAAAQPPSKLGVRKGTTISVEQAIKALIVKSANDVAVVVAESISGSEWRFAQKMTAKARALGMRRTTFRNASGLPNSKQVTTARDMATLARRLIHDHSTYFDYFATEQFVWNNRTYRSHNKLLRTFDGADGLKTGYTRRSGFNLATTAERNGHRLIGVVLGGRKAASRDRHMREILGNGFAAIKSKPQLIAALHRIKPEPRLKPSLAAAMEEEAAAPTLADNEEMRDEIFAAAASFGEAAASGEAAKPDALGALIAFADTDDFNEFEIARLASLTPSEGFVGEGDQTALAEFGWGVQIGAYSTKEMAQKELEEAANFGQATDKARSVKPILQADGVTLFRARIVNLTEPEANAVCARLQVKDRACFLIAAKTQP